MLPREEPRPFGTMREYGGELAGYAGGPPAPPGLSRYVCRSCWTISLLGEFGQQRYSHFLEGGELYAELLQLAVGLGQFGPRLPFSQVTITTPGPDQVLDLAA